MDENKRSRIEEIVEQFDLDRTNPKINAALSAIITEYEDLRKNCETERYKAKIDELTGLERKENLYPFLERNISRARRHNEDISVLMIDVDKFKHYNDTYGHIQGDNALRTVGSIVKSHLRKEDLAVRYGGEEVCVILPETNEEDAKQVAEILRESIERTQIPKRKGKEHKDKNYKHVTASIGIFTYNPVLDAVLGLLDENMSCEDEVKTLVEKADRALYEAKDQGKNRYCVAKAE